jgi:glucose-fructose oxidoreductase
MASVVMTFPGERLATFTCAFGGGHESAFNVVGTAGSAEMDPAFGYATELEYRIEADGERWAHTLPKSDQFAPELMHFSDCVRSGREPEPGGREGLNDVQIIRAIYESVRTGRAIELDLDDPGPRPSKQQARRSPSFPKPEEIHAASPKEG